MAALSLVLSLAWWRVCRGNSTCCYLSQWMTSVCDCDKEFDILCFRCEVRRWAKNPLVWPKLRCSNNRIMSFGKKRWQFFLPNWVDEVSCTVSKLLCPWLRAPFHTSVKNRARFSTVIVSPSHQIRTRKHKENETLNLTDDGAIIVPKMLEVWRVCELGHKTWLIV